MTVWRNFLDQSFAMTPQLENLLNQTPNYIHVSKLLSYIVVFEIQL